MRTFHVQTELNLAKTPKERRNWKESRYKKEMQAHFLPRCYPKRGNTWKSAFKAAEGDPDCVDWSS